MHSGKPCRRCESDSDRRPNAGTRYPRAATWYDATQVASPARPRLNFELDVDVCVVGAGLAGLTVAREVVRRGWSVAVLEANRIAWAASGRNTGFVLPGFSEDIDGLVERVGLDHAKQLWALSERGRLRPAHHRGDRHPGVDPVDGWLNVSKVDNERQLDAHVERLRWIGAEVDLWSGQRVRAVLPSRVYFNAVHFPRPCTYIRSITRWGLPRPRKRPARASSRRARRWRSTPRECASVSPLRRAGAGGHVVLAGNVNLGALVPRLGATLLPLTTYVMVSEPLGAASRRWLPRRGQRRRPRRQPLPHRRRGWRRAAAVVRAHDRVAGRAAPVRPQPARRHQAQFPRTRIGCGRASVAWHARPRGAPHAADRRDRARVWVASGFGGQGLNTTAMAGELIGRGIVEGDDTWRLFAPYELVWAGGLFGRAAAQGVYWGSRPLAGAQAGAGALPRTRAHAPAAKLAARNGHSAPAEPADNAGRHRSARPPSRPPSRPRYRRIEAASHANCSFGPSGYAIPGLPENPKTPLSNGAIWILPNG